LPVSIEQTRLTTTALFEAMQWLGDQLRIEMSMIDRRGGVPTTRQIDHLREQILTFQSLGSVLEKRLHDMPKATARQIRDGVDVMSRRLLARALGYETAYAVRREHQDDVPLFGAVTFSRDLRQLDRLAAQVTEAPPDLLAQVVTARTALKHLIRRCPPVPDFAADAA